jgi:hypothetical protein
MKRLIDQPLIERQSTDSGVRPYRAPEGPATAVAISDVMERISSMQ